jgi:Domain of unknown function (DUF4258)
MKKPLILTAHARIRLRERRIDPRWIDEAISNPEWIESDPRDPAIERRFRAVQQLVVEFFGLRASRQVRTFAL